MIEISKPRWTAYDAKFFNFTMPADEKDALADFFQYRLNFTSCPICWVLGHKCLRNFRSLVKLANLNVGNRQNLQDFRNEKSASARLLQLHHGQFRPFGCQMKTRYVEWNGWFPRFKRT